MARADSSAPSAVADERLAMPVLRLESSVTVGAGPRLPGASAGGRGTGGGGIEEPKSGGAGPAGAARWPGLIVATVTVTGIRSRPSHGDP